MSSPKSGLLEKDWSRKYLIDDRVIFNARFGQPFSRTAEGYTAVIHFGSHFFPYPTWIVVRRWSEQGFVEPITRDSVGAIVTAELFQADNAKTASRVGPSIALPSPLRPGLYLAMLYKDDGDGKFSPSTDIAIYSSREVDGLGSPAPIIEKLYLDFPDSFIGDN